MKTIKVLMSSLMIAGLLFTTSCSDDDEGSVTGGDLTARWNPDKTVTRIAGEDFETDYDHDPDCTKDYVEFTEDPNVVNIISFAEVDGTCQGIPSGTPTTWTRNDDTLIITGSPTYSGTYEIIRLTGSQLRIRSTNSAGGIETTTTIYFDKASNQQG